MGARGRERYPDFEAIVRNGVRKSAGARASVRGAFTPRAHIARVGTHSYSVPGQLVQSAPSQRRAWKPVRHTHARFTVSQTLQRGQRKLPDGLMQVTAPPPQKGAGAHHQSVPSQPVAGQGTASQWRASKLALQRQRPPTHALLAGQLPAPQATVKFIGPHCGEGRTQLPVSSQTRPAGHAPHEPSQPSLPQTRPAQSRVISPSHAVDQRIVASQNCAPSRQ